MQPVSRMTPQHSRTKPAAFTVFPDLLIPQQVRRLVPGDSGSGFGTTYFLDIGIWISFLSLRQTPHFKCNWAVSK